MPFASALSEHPVATQATGEVAGAVLESIGERPDLVVVTATRAHAGALEDIVRTVAAVLHPLAMLGCAAESVVGTGHEVEETPAIACGPAGSVRWPRSGCTPPGWPTIRGTSTGGPSTSGSSPPPCCWWPTRSPSRPTDS